MKEDEKIKPDELYVLSVQWSKYSYRTYYKRFNNETHYNNWCDFITSRGGKVIGTNLVEDGEK